MYEFKADPFVFLRKFLISFFELLDICCNKEIWNRANIMLYEELIGSVLLVEDGDILIIIKNRISWVIDTAKAATYVRAAAVNTSFAP